MTAGQSVLVVNFDVTLLHADVNGVLAEVVANAVAITAADHFFFAAALRNADLDEHDLLLAGTAGLFATAGLFTATGLLAAAGFLAAVTRLIAGIIHCDDARNCTRCHFVQVLVLHVFEECFRSSFNDRSMLRNRRRRRCSFLSIYLAQNKATQHQCNH